MKTQALRQLLKQEPFVYMPAAYDALGGRLVEDLGFKAVYVGGFVTGGSRCTSEPLLTMDEQVRVAGDVANAVKIPAVADGGAGFGEPLHTMRTVREFLRAGVSGIHIEDQLYPKRAHYHKYVAHAIPREEFVAKIKYACIARDETDKDFVIIARTDTCRSEGLEEAVTRLNMAADVGADMGMFFPRNDEEMKARTEALAHPAGLCHESRQPRGPPAANRLAARGHGLQTMHRCHHHASGKLSLFQEVPPGDLPHRNLYRHELPGKYRRAAADRRSGRPQTFI